MDGHLQQSDTVVCPFCLRAERRVLRREVKSDHRILHFCHCQHCGQHYQFAEDKSGKASVRER